MSTSILSAPGTRPAASLLVRTPRAARIVGRLLAVSVLAVALGLLLPWQQSVTGEGRVVAFAPLERQQELNAPIEGRIRSKERRVALFSTKPAAACQHDCNKSLLVT